MPENQPSYNQSHEPEASEDRDDKLLQQLLRQGISEDDAEELLEIRVDMNSIYFRKDRVTDYMVSVYILINLYEVCDGDINKARRLAEIGREYFLKYKKYPYEKSHFGDTGIVPGAYDSVLCKTIAAYRRFGNGFIDEPEEFLEHPDIDIIDEEE